MEGILRRFSGSGLFKWSQWDPQLRSAQPSATPNDARCRRLFQELRESQDATPMPEFDAWRTRDLGRRGEAFWLGGRRTSTGWHPPTPRAG